MNYLIKKYKGIYKLGAPISKDNMFLREYDESFADNDVYIDCNKNIKIFYYGGRGILQTYIPSIGMGRNIIKQIYYKYINPNNVIYDNKIIDVGNKKINKSSYVIKDIDLYNKQLKNLTKQDIIFDIGESDEEVWFSFKSDNDNKIFAFLNPKTSGAKRSPFSSKNLPKAHYDIPESDLNKYKELTKGFSIENGDWLKVTRITSNYLKSLTSRKYKIEDLNADMAKRCLKSKEFIHSIGKWDDYIKFLKKGLSNENN